ncbi:serine/threonine-protein kinase 11-interacting protein isoform X1 [Patella vulgata]|uniref:serine/threonine-protein kinase 11-interacting protein isoform X1 n=2 Tax=Patella vulgata TaxID=6465 RepID=UPI002180457B|nr:serine/threonine-protein kinase 11-interacting protein isoform X1 [Patella vulgata]
MPGQKEDQDFFVLGKLCSLLRENGGKIISGESKFALTTQSLGMLSTAFRRLSDVEYSDGGMSTALSLSPQNTLKWKEDVNFIRDFISRCPSLKIIHGTNTMQGAVQVQRFRNLQILEVKKAPIHMIEGLHHLRGQLRTVIVSRSLQHLQDLFETCGSDMSSPMSWPQLSSANLSFNSLTRLDGSLRLLPVLEVLDLSHNNLEKTDNYLEYLTELQRINLGYNMLDVVPTFSISAKGRLKTLVLKNNNLDSIQGVEELVLLEELDLCDNCLSEHSALQPLSSLVMLFQLKLSGNPLTYHSKHRQLTLKHLSALTLSTKFELDCKKVTNSELSQIKGVNVFVVRRPSAIAHGVISQPRYRSSENIISKDYMFDDSDNIATSLPVATSRKKRKRTKNRASDISDLESSTTELDSPDTSAASSPRPDYLRAAMKTRKEIELFRNHYGPDWLRAMEEEHVNTRQSDPVTSGTSDSDTNQVTVKVDTEQPMEIDSHDSFKQGPTDDDLYLLETSGSFKKTDMMNGNVDSHFERVDNSQEDKLEVKDEGIYMTADKKKDGVQRLYSVKGEEWNRTEEEEAEFYGDESEPFIVMIENEDYKQLIIVLNERYIVEKDLNGCVIDRYDLKCLKGFEMGETQVQHADVVDSVTLPQIQLSFDYIKKDRREKSYIMEDDENVQRLLDLLQPFLTAQDLKSTNNSLYQCLKCSNQFKAKDGILKKSEKMPSRGSSKDLQNINKNGKMLYKCNKCGSDLVIEVENPDKPETNSATSTPYGSYSSSTIGSYMDKKIYSPSQLSKQDTSPLANSTPVKNSSNKTEQIESENVAKRNLFSKGISKKSVISAVSGKGDNFDLETEGRRRSNAFIRDIISETSESQRTNSLNLPLEAEKSRKGIFHDQHSRTRIPSESDITILHTTSDASLGVTPNPSHDALINKLEQHLILTEEKLDSADSSLISEADVTVSNIEPSKQSFEQRPITPVGSPLSINVCSDMVSSVYLSSAAAEGEESNQVTEKNNMSDISVLCDESEATGNDSIYESSINKSSSSVEDDIVKVVYSRDPSIVSIPETDDSCSYKVLSGCDSADVCDSVTTQQFTDIDHRLKLHLMMSLFENSEEFQCIIETDICQYLISEEFLAYVVLSSDKFYILKITSQNRSDPPATWLTCLDIQPVNELFHVDVGLGNQSIRLEFGTDCSCYTLIIRDEKRCQDFVHHLEELFKSELFVCQQIKTFFTKEVCESTVKQLQSDVLTRKNGDERILVSYLMGYLVRGMNPKYPVSFVITDEELMLVKENHQWPQPRLQVPLDIENTAKHFTVLEKHKITNIVTVEKFEESETKLRLTLLDEESGGDTVWNITMETKHGTELFIDAVRGPWEAEFGVDLDVTMVTEEDIEES